MHRLLVRQIRRLFGDVETLPARLNPLFDAISESYNQADTDRAMIERSLDIASQEMLEQNRKLVSELNAREAAESQIQWLANYDGLTGLANRNLLSDRLGQAIAGAQRQTRKFAVLILGLDHFKLINESLGYAIGNELLKITSERLGSCVRGNDTVARLGGDEFALIFLDSRDNGPVSYPTSIGADDEFEGHLVEILQRLLKTVSGPVILSDKELQVTCSIGLALYPQDGAEGENLLKNADSAMNSAKQLGKNTFQFYTSDISARIEARLEMQGQLRVAIERNEFVLHYQPQLDLCTGYIIGVEALVRWNHPKLGMVPPILFIGLAEETGLIVPIGAWVIRTACEQCKAWQRDGFGKLRMAVNLSVRQFAQPDLVDYIASVLKETDLEPQWLEVELTESLVMNNVEQSIEILQRLKQLGLQMSIDDFGTGYSSLAYLKRFPIDLLKIDQSFVRDILSSDDAAIVKAIISMAHSLGLMVIAEGVETEAQCEFLQQNMCDEIQGYLFSKPIDAKEMAEILRIGKRLPTKLLRSGEKKRTL